MQPLRARTTSILFLFLFGWAVFLRPSFMLNGPASYIFVAGTSMEPTMYTGDLAVLRRSDTYAVGDVVAFRVGEGIVIHRVIGGDSRSGYAIQGDNKPLPDLWRPTPDRILGRMLVHIPSGALVLAPLQSPTNFGVFVAVLSALTLPAAATVRRHRKGGRIVQEGLPGTAAPRPKTVRTSSTPPADLGGGGPLAEAPRLVVVAFFATAVAAIFATLLGVYAVRQPLTQSTMQPTLQFTQTGAFDYAIEVAPSAIYPRGSVGPLPGADSKDAAAPEQAVYTRLAQGMDIQYRYALASDQPSNVRGTLRADLEVRAEGGWAKVEPFIAAASFEGAAVDASARIDLHALTALLEQIEAETGFEARSYDVLVKPTVTIEGHVGAEAVQETFTSSLLVRVDPTRIAPQGALEQSAPMQRADLVTTPRTIGIGARQATVQQVRLASIGVAVGAGTLAALLAGVIFLGLGRGEEAKIRARYGSLLLRVQAAEDDTVRDRVRVVSMRDLARLARRDPGGLIMEEHERLGPRYSVRDGDTIYEFVPEAPGHRQRFTEFVMRRDPDPGPAATPD